MKSRTKMARNELHELGIKETLRRVLRYLLSSTMSKLLRPLNRTFSLNGITYKYTVSPRSYDNERSIEIPIVINFLKGKSSRNKIKVLEIGNVLNYYNIRGHDVLDKYEIYPGVINEDITQFNPIERYDIIISISTLEHVGQDEPVKEKEKVIKAIFNIKELLKQDGVALIAVPIGYNLTLDEFISHNQPFFASCTFMRRLTFYNKWRETNLQDAMNNKYAKKFPYGNAEAFLYLKR